MSGHSKWSTIKHKKAANDAKRGKIFTRLAREIAIAAREGGGDPDTNFNLRLALDRAKANNMPNDNIDRAIKRGTGESKEGGSLEQLSYEGYAPHGVALIIDVLTDNRNRAVADIRHVLTTAGGSLGEGGSVAWQFTRSAYFGFPSKGHGEDQVFELAVEAGADDVIFEDDYAVIVAPLEAFRNINQQLRSAGVKPEEAELRMIPNQEVELPPDKTLAVMRVIEKLEDLDDVQRVSSNLFISEEAIEKLEVA